MSANKSPLDNLKIASPCSASWNEMYGNERKRFCGDCKLNVYNLSGMTRDDAERLLVSSEGQLCVRYFRRADGTVLTKDCPVGWAKVRQRLSVYTTAAFSLILTFLTGVFFVSIFRKTEIGVRRIPSIFASPTPEPLMGAIAISPTMGKPQMGETATPTNQDDRRRLEQMVGQVEVVPAKRH
ncbi:MAG: hypothetical protein ABI791_01315 [Acidobacteriota bacterium]